MICFVGNHPEKVLGYRFAGSNSVSKVVNLLFGRILGTLGQLMPILSKIIGNSKPPLSHHKRHKECPHFKFVGGFEKAGMHTQFSLYARQDINL